MKISKLSTAILYISAFHMAYVNAGEITYTSASITDSSVTEKSTYTFELSALGDNDYETRMFLLTTDGGSFSSTASVSVTGPSVASTDWINNQKGGMGIKQSANSTVELKSGASLAYKCKLEIKPV